MLSSLLVLASWLPSTPTGHTLANTGRTVAWGQFAVHQVEHRTIFVEYLTRSVDIYDAMRGQLVSLGLPVSYRAGQFNKYYELRVFGSFFVFLADEAAAGVDLNGNGTLLDEVLHIHDLRSGVTHNTPARCPAPVRIGSDVLLLGTAGREPRRVHRTGELVRGLQR